MGYLGGPFVKHIVDFLVRLFLFGCPGSEQDIKKKPQLAVEYASCERRFYLPWLCASLEGTRGALFIAARTSVNNLRGFFSSSGDDRELKEALSIYPDIR